jgi:hypothetical protein
MMRAPTAGAHFFPLEDLSQCPLLALSGHPGRAQRCPLSGVKRNDLDGLVENGHLSPDKRKDLHAIELAIEDFMFDCFTRAFPHT